MVNESRILVIEDDPDLNELICFNLQDLNYHVTSYQNGRQGLDQALTGNYDLILLDLSLPEVDGLSICTQVRANHISSSIIMLTAKDSEADRVVGLEVGADDYITKPFSVRELQARVKAMLRRAEILTRPSQTPVKPLNFGELQIDEDKRTVFLAERSIDLTSTEFDLLLYMAKKPGTVFNRTQLLENVWGYRHSGYEHTVNSHINRLRTKLESDPSKPQYVLTVWGVGYRFASHE